MSIDEIINIAAYKFVPLDRLVERRDELRALCTEANLKGTILLSPEGINLFIAGTREQISVLMNHLRTEPAMGDLTAKESPSDRQPFNRMLVKLKREIIAFGWPGIAPAEYTSRKITPQQLQQQLNSDSPPVMLDVRNDYETKLGTFKNAVTLDIGHFKQFPDAITSLPTDLKSQPIVMFCTGGIRCEKAGPFMEQQGFSEIYQLDGGILKYFEDCQDDHYDGECFVFDQRVSVDSKLRETETTQCYRCQAPLTAAEQQHPAYQPNESCPYCHQEPSQQLANIIKQRQEQIAAATNPLPGSEPYTNRRPIFITAKHDNTRLLDFLSESFPFTKRDDWQQRIEAGLMYRDGSSIDSNDIVRAGNRLEHHFPNTTEPNVNGNIEVLFEDEWIIGVNKPAPLPMHPCGRFNRNTLIPILETAYHPQKLRPAHRLDANTTGIVVLSRKQEVARKLQPRFETGHIHKTYLAKVHGHPAENKFACEAGISVSSLEAGARTIDPNGLTARTEFNVLSRNDDGTSLLKVHPITGRTNQIRLHLWHLQLPICGDRMYLPGGELGKKQTLEVTDEPLCLHAWRIEFDHPMTEQAMLLESPQPKWTNNVALATHLG